MTSARRRAACGGAGVEQRVQGNAIGKRQRRERRDRDVGLGRLDALQVVGMDADALRRLLQGQLSPLSQAEQAEAQAPLRAIDNRLKFGPLVDLRAPMAVVRFAGASWHPARLSPSTQEMNNS